MMENSLAKEIFDDICTENHVRIDPEKRNRIAVQFNENMQIAEDMESEQYRHSAGEKSDYETIQELKEELKEVKEENCRLKRNQIRFSSTELSQMFKEANRMTMD